MGKQSNQRKIKEEGNYTMTEMKNHFRARTAETELMVSTKVSGRVVDNLHPAHAIPNNSAIPKLPC